MQLIPEDTTESGVLYLVHNKHGQGKHLVRRPAPPPTSAPLDDDFDATTTLPPNTPRALRSPWEKPTSNDLAGSVSPLDDDFDAVTYTIAPGREAEPTLDGLNRRNLNTRRNENLKAPSPPRGENMNGGGGGFETYGEYGRYLSDLERKFGNEAPDLTLSPGRQGRELPGPADRSGQTRISKPTKLGSVVKATGPGAGQLPRGGQSFEIVNRRVLEDGPERTVLISTWREQVADATDGREGMDVYYLDAMDYAAADGGANVDTTFSEVDSPARRKAIMPPPVRKRSGSERGSYPGSIRSIPDEGSRGERSLPEQRATQRKIPGQTYYMDDARATPTATTRSRSTQSWNHTSPRNATPDTDKRLGNRSLNSLPPRAAPNGKTNHYVPAGETSPPPRSSTPIRRSPERERERMHTPLLGSSPNRMPGGSPHRIVPSSPNPTGSSPNRTGTGAYQHHLYQHQQQQQQQQQQHPHHPATPVLPTVPSFHPTQSGSTISTIKSASTLIFESVLASCDPPLLHIAPALVALGIRNEGHLRAVARMSEETRDKEVREEALRRGVTVVEWAMLLDRLQRL